MAETTTSDSLEADFPSIDDGTAPSLVIDGFQGVSTVNGTVRLNCYTLELNTQKDRMERVVRARVVMTIPALVAINATLGRLIEQFEEDGRLAKDAAPDDRGGD